MSLNREAADPKADKPAKKSDDTALIAEMVKYVNQSRDADSDDRTAALDDLQFLVGKQWPDQIAAQRQQDGRPCLTINKLPTFLHQVTNDQRQNTPSLKVHPVDDGADEETAEVIQSMTRHIEYASNADVAYDTAVNGAASCGRGFWRLVTKYCSDESFYQEIAFERIRNAFTVFFDPNSKEPDGSDQMRCAIVLDVPRWMFKSEFPNADVSPFVDPELSQQSAGWLTESTIRLAVYYRVELTPDTLVMLSDGSTGFKSKLDEQKAAAANITIVQERPTKRREVWAYKATARQVLERTQIPCKWIPVFPVWGDEIDVNGKVVRAGVIRNAKDPARMYNVWMTNATEEYGLRPKVPWVMAEGQQEGNETAWAQANTRPQSYITYKPVTLGDQLAPPPRREGMGEFPVGAMQMAMHANDDIKATTGLFDASLGAHGNETSGRAIIARQKEGDVANFHFTDNLARSIRHCGRCIIDMIPKVYDTERVVRILGEDGETISTAKINTPGTKQVQGENGEMQAIETVLNDLTVGEYDVTVTMGPSYTTQRQEAVAAMTELGQSWPKLMDIAGDKVVRAMDWPGADEIAERIARTIPPEIRDGEDGNQPPPIPPEVQQQMQQMDQVIQNLQQQLHEAQSGIAAKQIDAQSRENVANTQAAASVRVAEVNAASKQDVEELKGVIAMLIAKMTPPQDLANEVSEDLSEEGGTNRPAKAPADQAQQGSQGTPDASSTGQNLVG